jgi:hypothetical protein
MRSMSIQQRTRAGVGCDRRVLIGLLLVRSGDQADAIAALLVMSPAPRHAATSTANIPLNERYVSVLFSAWTSRKACRDATTSLPRCVRVLTAPPTSYTNKEGLSRLSAVSPARRPASPTIA